MGLKGFFKGLFGKGEAGKYSWYTPAAKITDGNLGQAIDEANKAKNDGLVIKDTKISAKGLGKLKDMKSLRALRLEKVEVTDKDLGSVLKDFKGLEYLDLTGSTINGSCFVEIKTLPKLWYADVKQTAFVDVAILALRTFPELHTLDVSGTKVTHEGIPKAMELKSLRLLRAHDLNLDDSVLATFAQHQEIKVEL